MGTYRFSVHVEAPPGVVFRLWTDVDRMHEWVEGVTKVSDRTGPTTVVGTRYVVSFGGMKSPTEVLEADPPRRFRTRFGNRMLRGQNASTFEPEGSGTRVTETFTTEGIIPAIAAWIFARGSYKGSFQGELEAFAKIAEREPR